MPPSVRWAILAVRISGLFVATLALWQMLGNILGTYRDFDPSYILYYFTSQMARPTCGFILGILLWLFSRLFGRLLARGLEK